MFQDSNLVLTEVTQIFTFPPAECQGVEPCKPCGSGFQDRRDQPIVACIPRLSVVMDTEERVGFADFSLPIISSSEIWNVLATQDVRLLSMPLPTPNSAPGVPQSGLCPSAVGREERRIRHPTVPGNTASFVPSPQIRPDES